MHPAPKEQWNIPESLRYKGLVKDAPLDTVGTFPNYVRIALPIRLYGSLIGDMSQNIGQSHKNIACIQASCGFMFWKGASDGTRDTAAHTAL
jgi:hypothetical protein